MRWGKLALSFPLVGTFVMGMNIKDFLVEFRKEIIQRLHSYQPPTSYFVKMYTTPNLQAQSEKIEKMITSLTVDSLGLLMNNFLSPMSDSIESLWVLLAYKDFFTEERTELINDDDYIKLLPVLQTEEQMQKGKERLKMAARKLTDEQNLLMSVDEYIQEAPLFNLLQSYRLNYLGDILTLTSMDIARLILVDVAKKHNKQQTFTLEHFQALASVHVIRNPLEKDVRKGLKAFFYTQKNLPHGQLREISADYFFRQMKPAEILDKMEKYTITYGTNLALRYYLLKGNWGPRILSQMLRDIGIVEFQGISDDLVTKGFCKDPNTCYDRLAYVAATSRMENYKPVVAKNSPLGTSPCQSSDFERIALIKKGDYSSVTIYEHLKSRKMVAIKEIDSNIVKQFPEMVLREEFVAFQVKNEFVGSAYCTFKDDAGNYHLVMPLHAGKQLSWYYQPKQDEKFVIRIIAQLIEAAMAMLNAGFRHHDIKGDNVIVSKEGNIKLIDFNMAQQVNFDNLHESYAKNGNILCRPPEAHLELPCGPAYELFSIGLMAYFVINGNGKHQFEGLLQQGCIEFAKNYLKGKIKLQPMFESKEFKDLLSILLAPSPYERWEKVYVKWEEFQKHPAFTKIGYKWTTDPREALEESKNSPPPTKKFKIENFKAKEILQTAENQPSSSSHISSW